MGEVMVAGWTDALYYDVTDKGPVGNAGRTGW